MALDPGIFQLLNTKGGPASNLTAVRDYENAGIQGQLGQAQIQRVGLENQQLQQEMALRPDMLRLKQAQADAAIQENLAKMDKAKLDKINAWNTRAGQIWASVNDETSYQRAKAAIRQEALANGVQIPEGYDPHPPAYDPGFVRQEVEKSMTMDQRLKQEENRRSADRAQQDFEFRGNQFEETKRHNKAMENKPSSMAIFASGMGGGKGFDPSQPLPDIGMEAIAQAIARKEQPPQEYSIRNPAGKIINARAAMLGGGEIVGKGAQATRQAGLKDFEPQGTSGKTISAINTMTEHLSTMEKAVSALKLGDIPAANKAAQAIGIQFGDDKASNAKVIKGFLAGEVAKVASGGHLTEGEIRKAEENIMTAGSPAQALGALNMMKEIAGGKLIAINQDHIRLTGKTLAEGKRLTPATIKAFTMVSGGHENQKLSPEDAAKLPSGTKFIGLDGIERTKR